MQLPLIRSWILLVIIRKLTNCCKSVDSTMNFMFNMIYTLISMTNNGYLLRCQTDGFPTSSPKNSLTKRADDSNLDQRGFFTMGFINLLISPTFVLTQSPAGVDHKREPTTNFCIRVAQICQK